ncbi:MAG: DUF4445 domain-containing protein [Anaerolineales bacterium]|nr:DUF4445 domain-containing protein [Anaerolineales bacterium]
MPRVTFFPENITVAVEEGSTISDAVAVAGLDVSQPCGEQGRCGRCLVLVRAGSVRRRSTFRLSERDVNAGYALACQTVLTGDAVIEIPPQEEIARRLVTEKTYTAEIPLDYDPVWMQNLKQIQVTIPPPTLDDNRDDLSRLENCLNQHQVKELTIPLMLLRTLNQRLRETNWKPWLVLYYDRNHPGSAVLIDIRLEQKPLCGLAIDIGTTTVSANLMDLDNGIILASAAEYNAQIARGEDIISRIIYATKYDGLSDLADRVRRTIRSLLDQIIKSSKISPEHICRVTIAGNPTMMHLFLQLPPGSIRLEPYIPTINHTPLYYAHELEIPVYPLAVVDSLPGAASYVGADISAGVHGSGLNTSDSLSLFIDVGTNGEIVLGNQDWLVTCACSAGPAFEGAGVVHGMRAARGAIEEVWIHGETLEPTYRVIGDSTPRGICGSGLISLLAEMFATGVVDRSGNISLDLDTPRTREGLHGPEYVVAFAEETDDGRDISITKVDIDNLIRAKAAIFAGFNVLVSSVGLELENIDRILIGGAFGNYINIEKAIQIGMMPDIPRKQFHFLGNTSLMGTSLALLSHQDREAISSIADKMTYIELSADNSFYEQFTAACFLPHTDINLFPTVMEIWNREKTE